MTTKKHFIVKPIIVKCPFCNHVQATGKKIGLPICCSDCKRYSVVKGKR